LKVAGRRLCADVAGWKDIHVVVTESEPAAVAAVDRRDDTVARREIVDDGGIGLTATRSSCPVRRTATGTAGACAAAAVGGRATGAVRAPSAAVRGGACRHTHGGFAHEVVVTGVVGVATAPPLP